MTKLAYTIDIDAPLQMVWEILTDFSQYDRWNTFTPVVRCDGILDKPVIVEAYLKPDSQRPVVNHLFLKAFDPQEKLCWGYERWYLQVLRCQTIQAGDDGRTRYHNWETFEGLLSPIVMATQRTTLLAAYQRAAENLKAYAENLAMS